MTFVLPDIRIIYDARTEFKVILLMRWKPTMKKKARSKRKETLALARSINDMRLRLKNITKNLGLTALFMQLVMSKLFRDS